MDPVRRAHAETIDRLRKGLSDLAADAMLDADPALAGRYGSDARRIWRTELGIRLAHLAESIACGRPAMFAAHAAGAASALRVRRVPDRDIDAHLAQLEAVLSAELPDDAAAAALPFLRAARDTACAAHEPYGLLDSQDRDSTLARLFLLHLLQREKDQAATVALDALRGGMKLVDVHERVLAPALGEVGRMWQSQEASIADEHYCTAAARVIAGQLRGAAQASARRPDGRRALCAAMGGDMHDTGLRMAADLLELDGWTAEYLGADVPAAEVVMAVEDGEQEGGRRIDLVVVSASTDLAIRPVADLVAALRMSPTARRVPVLVGGGPFSADPTLAREVGADAGASSLRGAVAEAASLVPARGPTAVR
jgi:methanogenic corrinoid protein MtbC1